MPHKGKVIVLESREWEVSTPPKGFGIKLVPSKIVKEKNEKEKEVELYFADKETQEKWLSRLKRVCMNEATHGIEIQSMEIDNAITQEYFQKRRNTESNKDKGKGKGKLELSVWDFAGQHDYYNNHLYLLSTRTVFMVLWKLHEWRENLNFGFPHWPHIFHQHPLPQLQPQIVECIIL